MEKEQSDSILNSTFEQLEKMLEEKNREKDDQRHQEPSPEEELVGDR